MKQPQRGRKGQKGGRIDFSKVPPTAKLGRVPSSFGGGARGARGRFFEKNFSAHEVTDSPNLIQVNSISQNLRPHETCITLVGMPTGGRHNCRAVIRAKSLPRTPIRSLPRAPTRGPESSGMGIGGSVNADRKCVVIALMGFTERCWIGNCRYAKLFDVGRGDGWVSG